MSGFDLEVQGAASWLTPAMCIAVVFVGDEAEKQALLLGEPEVFFTARGYGEVPLVLLRLAAVDAVRLEELISDAWEMRRSNGPAPGGAAAGG